MLYRLYLDFDGVIWDTWPYLYQALYEANYELYEKMVCKKTTYEEEILIGEVFKKIDWAILLRNTRPLNDSINCIKRLQKTGLFDMGILTHCNTNNEITNKTILVNRELPGTKIIPVFKPVCKSSAVDPRGAILVDDYGKNLSPWQAAGGIGVKFSLINEEKNGFYNINSLDQILDIIERIKQDEELLKQSFTKQLRYK